MQRLAMIVAMRASRTARVPTHVASQSIAVSAG
jgi:hypothetical protein